jgi:PAS domain S-box-containing protein
MSSTATASQSAPAHAQPASDAPLELQQLTADRAAQLYSQLPAGIVASVVLIVVAVYALRGSNYTWVVYGWSAVALAVTAVRAVLWWLYQRDRERDAEADRWMRWLAIGALASGTLWGVLASLFFELQNDLEHLFILMVLGGVLVGGIAMYAASWPIYAVYGAPVVLPFTYGLVTHELELFRVLSPLVPMFYAACVGVAYRLNTLFLSGFRAQQSFRKLNTEYVTLNQHMERQLDELALSRWRVEESGRKLALFVERSPVAVFELDPQGRALHVNPAAEALFGYAGSELDGRALADVLFSPERRAEILSHWRSLLRERTPITRLRQTTPRRDGHEIICEWSLTPLVNAQGRVISVIAQVRDITQQLEAERLKQEFTSTLSHELRTPLTAILGALQLVNSGALGSASPAIQELTEVAERNGQRLLDLINDLLDLEKIESGKLPVELQAMRLDELVREALTLNRAFAERYKIRLEAASGLCESLVRVDRRRMLQVLTNLVSNAAKFSPEGSVVEVTLEERGTQLRLGVHDRGPGIPASFLGRVFTRFSQADMSLTREKGGTGLGLAICKRLVELMGGHIGFHDREGGGTTFWIDLPKDA